MLLSRLKIYLINLAKNMRQVQLSSLLSPFGVEYAGDIACGGLSLDSRCIESGWAFCALRGLAQDGRDFVEQAVAAGANAILYDPAEGELSRDTVACIAVPELAASLPQLAADFYGNPSREIPVIGITGTNGKTSCGYFIAQLLTLLGRPCACFGTLGMGMLDNLSETENTTVDAVTLQRQLRHCIEQGAQALVMEVSSHAIDQRRVNAVAFDIAALTQITQDHLDYHGTMACYAATKLRFFDWPTLSYCVINADDPRGLSWLEQRVGDSKNVAYSMANALTGVDSVVLTSQQPSADGGTAFEVQTTQGVLKSKTHLLGQFNLENLLLCITVLFKMGYTIEQVAAAIPQLQPVPGRMEFFHRDGLPTVVVDFAHTPDALEKALQALRSHVSGKLTCIFGCGGERDRGKRPQMAAIAERVADHVVVTADNPRSEALEQIMADIEAGFSTMNTVEFVYDREQAIKQTIARMQPNDLVLIAGKGHERGQYVGETKLDYSDRDYVQQLFEEVA